MKTLFFQASKLIHIPLPDSPVGLLQPFGKILSKHCAIYDIHKDDYCLTHELTKQMGVRAKYKNNGTVYDIDLRRRR